MKHGFFHKALTLCMAAALLLALAVPAMADTVASNTAVGYTTNPTFIKRLTMDTADIPTPASTFSFTIQPGTPIDGSGSTPNVLAGPTKTVDESGTNVTYPKIADVSFAADEAKEAGQTYAQKTATIDFSNVTFPNPGVYRYEVQETAPATIPAGFTYDTTIRYLDVYVVDLGGNGGLTIANTILHTGADIKDNAGGAYGDVKDGIVKNEYTTSDLTVSKTVAGNQGDRTKYFKFNVTISGAPEGTVYAVDLSDATATAIDLGGGVNVTNAATITVGTGDTVSVTYYLKHDQSIKIQGLASDVSYTIEEEQDDTEGYTVTTALTNATDNDTTDATAKIVDVTAIGTDDDTVAYTNTRNGVVPTGILLDVAPYALLVLLAGAALVLVLSRRKAADR